MYEKSLLDLGLTYPQAIIYEFLVKEGVQKAGVIAQKTQYKRGLVYKVLDELEKMQLVKKTQGPKFVGVFEACHPVVLRDFAEKRELEAKNSRLSMESIISSIISDFNLSSDKPGVIFYEGKEGIKKVLADALEDNPEKSILCFSDVEGYYEHLSDWNKKFYTPHREEKKIFEKVIAPNSHKALEIMESLQKSMLTETMFIDHKLFPFATEINIYNNKISIVTFSEKGLIGVIIENKEIHETLKSIFNLTWITGGKYYKHLQPSWAKTPSDEADEF